MEKSFRLSKENKYYQDLQKYIADMKIQNKFIKEFFKEKGIDGTAYDMGGDGCVGCPFDEDEKNKIYLYIESTENNLKKFGNILGKETNQKLCRVKRNSKLGKEFAQKCIDTQSIINVNRPDLYFHFKSLGLQAYSYMQFIYNDKLYIKIDSNYLKDDDTPEGCTEIKLSEFYKAKEEYESSRENSHE